LFDELTKNGLDIPTRLIVNASVAEPEPVKRQQFAVAGAEILALLLVCKLI
jgi:hypothetical protein